ncbi:hypothetical protein [Paraburkholderia dilworthii]|uniref:hypothetical protein n=1 Tax=Paraburkholderia dilworthii TaxID=948106 RepID=UPI00048607CC|nr:hypothetical protein [Paraburkholderia dilworthii]
MAMVREPANWRKGKRLSIEDMQALAQERNGRCLSSEYGNLSTKLRWQCAEGHVWEAAPHGLRQCGAWCPECAFEKLRLKIGDMHAVARERGGECLSTLYVNNETKLRWRCAQGHEWDAKPMHIRLGTWCPKCGRQSRMLKMDIQATAQARGGTCLSTHYDNDGRKLR